MSTAAPAPIEAISRAMLLLVELSAVGPDGASLAALAERAEINKSTAYRALSTLRSHGFVVQVDGLYRLGPAAVRLGERFLATENLAGLLHDPLTTVAEELGEIVHLGALQGAEVVYLDKVEPAGAMRVWSAVGRVVPAAVSAMGRSMLAFSDVDRSMLTGYLAVLPARLSPDEEHIWQVICDARRTGYATEIRENEPGVACLAIPLLRGRTPIAAVSLTAPADRLTADAMPSVHHRLLEVLEPLLPAGLSVPSAG